VPLVSQHPQAPDTEIAEDLCTHAILAQGDRRGFDSRLRLIGSTQQRPRLPASSQDLDKMRRNAERVVSGMKDDRDPAAFPDYGRQGIVERPVHALLVQGQQLVIGIGDMHPDQCGAITSHHAVNQRHMMHPTDEILEDNHLKGAMDGLEGRHPNSGHCAFMAQAVVDEIRNGTHSEMMANGKLLEIGPPRHVTVIAQHLHDHSTRFESCQTRQVATSLCMTRSHQHPPIHGNQGEDVAWRDQIFGLGLRRHGHLDSAGSVMGRDACGNPLCCVDGQGEVGPPIHIGTWHHQGQPQLVATRPGQG